MYVTAYCEPCSDCIKGISFFLLQIYSSFIPYKVLSQVS